MPTIVLAIFPLYLPVFKTNCFICVILIIGDFAMGAAGNKKPKKPGKKHGPSYMEEEHDVPLKSLQKKTK